MRRHLLAGLLLFLAAPAWSAEPAAPPGVPVQVKRLLLVDNVPAVLLMDPSEQRYLLLFIDFFMASSIQAGIDQAAVERPMTHDLMGILLRRAGVQLTRIVITGLKDHTYYALITMQVNGQSQDVDARPSDALALAVRNHVPVFAAPGLLRAAPGSGPGGRPREEPPAPGGASGGSGTRM
jgi:bifunctional DNase/RNase